jgi:hypothetical protein
MINRSQLLKDLQGLLRRVEEDLLERSHLDTLPEVQAALRSEYEQAKQSERTALSYEEWRSDYAMHIGAAWILSGVFVRFLEDNELIDPPLLAGAGNRLQRARDEYEQYFRSHPTETDREYLLAGFRKLAKLSGGAEIFGQHNPVYEVPTWLSGDVAGELLKFFQQIDPGTGMLVHDFTDANWDTRFLGDLYQDLSERARKKYALLQTPQFVEQFILERTLEPAIEAFGLEGFRMIDPACGSGHFLLGAFQRLMERWYRQDPNEKYAVLAQRSLDSVHGVDINPFAVAIARFRLLLAAMKEAGITGLRNAPDFKIHLACGDSLLHGEGIQLELEELESPKKHHYKSEDITELNQILVPGHYHAVVANPPYIVPKDAAANAAYRKLYRRSCHRQYSLAMPFMERIFQLAVERGFTGQITANSFMKREFGKKLIEGFFPTVDLTHVIDTSGAYIPGHGTPTVIVFGRNRRPIDSKIRTVMGIKGEPSTPENAAQGLVWSAICDQVDVSGSQSEFVSVADSVRDLFHKHPWSIGGGGASDLKEQLDSTCSISLTNVISEIGFMIITGEDNCLVLPSGCARRIRNLQVMPMGDGESLRDWSNDLTLEVLWCNDRSGKRLHVSKLQPHLEFLWAYRTSLKERKAFGVPVEQKGIPWWAIREVYCDKISTPLSIAFAFVATHNHFVLDRGGKVFKQSAPVIKLSANATEDDHLALLGLLNSSTACFWMKQICQNKGATSDKGVLQADPEKFRFEFDGTKLSRLPIPSLEPADKQSLIQLTELLDQHGRELSSDFTSFISNSLKESRDLKITLNDFLTRREKIRSEMVRLQEELDWLCYELYGLLPQLSEVQSQIWATAPADFPALAPDARPYRMLESEDISALAIIDQARVQLIRNNAQIKLIESPEYKRRWFKSAGAYDDNNLDDSILLERGLQSWLLDRLETYFDFDGRMNDDSTPTAQVPITILSTAKLADLAQQDPDFMQVGALCRHSDTFHLQTLIDELIEAESVPLLPILCYKPTGLRKRAEWEHTWTLQRQEDAIDARTQLPADHPDHLTLLQAKDRKTREIGTIPVPPKYTSADFLSHYWRLRGKLDVPKERWVSFPYCEGNDGKLAIAWAGYDHLQLTQALSNYYIDIKENLGGSEDPRLIPILACLLELLPWLKQWHSAIDPTYGYAMSAYFEDFIQSEARYLNQTLDQIRAWDPPKRTTRRR